MPFDLSNKICHQHSIISDLVQQADEALKACERETCVDLIQHIYELLDSATAASVVIPADGDRSEPVRDARCADGALISSSRILLC